jgi:SH3-like domain-containing protein
MASPRLTSYFFLIILTSCGPPARHDPVLAEAFVGPANVNLRKDLAPSETVATLHFGEKVQIVGKKRIFVRVRTRGGVEGWIDEAMLLGQSDIDQIGAQSAAARSYPSQGAAVTDVAMNVHAEPTQLSPSYIQLKAGEKFEVLQHRLIATPASPVRKSVVPATPKGIRKPKKENKSRIPPPPAPKAPPLPLDWVDLSREGADAIPPKPEEEPVAIPYQDWSMIRTSSGQSGWVLSRRLFMAIPDEVAQYAEGHRITSYFPLGKVQDQDRVKYVWLWTTSQPGVPYDFDGFRVFIWSLRRHRYETALIQRRLQGYFPTLVDSSAGTFSVCLQKADGLRYRREYRLVENLVKFVEEKPCAPGVERNGTPAVAVPKPPDATQGTFDKLKGKLKSIMK